jgi:hypothetical protein
MGGDSSGPARSSRPSRPLVLLRKVIDCGALEPSEVAHALVVSDVELAAYLAGLTAIPLDRQLRLASLVIKAVPSLARLGHQLRGQAAAAVSFEAHATATHSTTHPKIGW